MEFASFIVHLVPYKPSKSESTRHINPTRFGTPHIISP